MATYKKILIALDFQSDNSEILAKGREIAGDNAAEIFLVHVNEPLAIAYATDGMNWSDQVVSLEVSIRKESEAHMAKLGKELNLRSENCIIKEGRPSAEIHAICKERDIDLVVLGTHGQSGLQLLLGSTANSVLHGSTCDVLSVRVGK
ncbi:MAG: universal stress protein UspA [Gammaproteobacteria bacterium]|jgi:universal stress protein A|nr:universal stress protein UspA [Gammaproteobacteria bacterium]|tara:strand:+ start:1349 stop:1792 length:444 start_codon:yes stop_codon:yes gene_type:complete